MIEPEARGWIEGDELSGATTVLARRAAMLVPPIVAALETVVAIYCRG